MYTVTAPMLAAHLFNIVGRFGADHTAGGAGSKGCVYGRREGFVLTPVCIIGVVLHDLGILRAAVAYEPGGADDQPGWHGACTIHGAPEFWAAVEQAGIHFTEDAKSVAWHVQNEQDSDGWDSQWGNAVPNGIRKARSAARESLVNEHEIAVRRLQSEHQDALWEFENHDELGSLPVPLIVSPIRSDQEAPLTSWEAALLNDEPDLDEPPF